MELLCENKLCPMSNLSQIAAEDIQTYEEFVTANYCQFAAAGMAQFCEKLDSR